MKKELDDLKELVHRSIRPQASAGGSGDPSGTGTGEPDASSALRKFFAVICVGVTHCVYYQLPLKSQQRPFLDKPLGSSDVHFTSTGHRK